jgi:hypothetical protein
LKQTYEQMLQSNPIQVYRGGFTKKRTRTRSKGMNPPKYYAGLSKTKRIQRKKEIQERSKLHWNNPKAYATFSTNVGIKTRKSSYTSEWDRKFPTVKSLKDRATMTGVPLRYIEESYNRGLAAWRTGHRPGATQQQWGYARVSSFLLCGKTHYTTDSDLVRLAKQTPSARKWWKSCHDTPLTQYPQKV